MLFNSFQFLLFLPLVIFSYFLIPYRYRWVLLLAASYFFYMCWKVEYALLIFFTTFVSYITAILMERQENKKSRGKYLFLSLFVNVGILFVFKYYNFLNGSIKYIFDHAKISYNVPYLNLLLPIGISFYTFQTIAYMVDVYNGKQKSEKHFGIFALYVSFFPQLVAGPIERSYRLIPQFHKKHPFDTYRLILGLKLIVWGYFKKLVIADRLAIYVNAVYNNYSNHSAITLLLATIFFSIQIYCDFSAYSDIAIGSARIMGFDLMKNFNRPYFSESIREFWSRWHISLSTWFKDYVYIPLGGNRVVKWRWNFNILLTFIISGLWHGANWTFVVWGAIHGVYLLLERWLEHPIYKFFSKTSSVSRVLRIAITFTLVCFAWIFFRANTINDAIGIFYRILLFDTNLYIGKAYYLVYSLIGIAILFIVELRQEFNSIRFLDVLYKSSTFRFLSYVFIAILILIIGVFDGGQFIYFQF